MVLLFSCGCETDASAPAEFRFITLTSDTPSTGGTENWGTFTETLPWATLSFRKLSWWRSLKQQEKKEINKGSSVEHCWHVMALHNMQRRDLAHFTISLEELCVLLTGWGYKGSAPSCCCLFFLPVLWVIPRSSLLAGSRVVTWLRVSVHWIEVVLPSCRVIIPDIHSMMKVCG